MHLITSRISHPFPQNPNSPPVKNLIFDFGGVICNINVKLTEKAFIGLGIKKFDTRETITATQGLFEKMEIGTITPERFRMELRNYFDHHVTDDQLDGAWNALLLDVPEHRLRLLEKLRLNYRIFLLSNSNAIHYRKYLADFTRIYGYNSFDDLFEKAYFSFNIGHKKPGREIFEYVISNSHLDPAETLFIDDTLIHVEGATKVGLNAHHLEINDGEEITDLFA